MNSYCISSSKEGFHVLERARVCTGERVDVAVFVCGWQGSLLKGARLNKDSRVLTVCAVTTHVFVACVAIYLRWLYGL